MGKETLIQKIKGLPKELAYKIALPVYLWSIGFKTLNDYISEIEKQYQYGLNQSKKKLK